MGDDRDTPDEEWAPQADRLADLDLQFSKEGLPVQNRPDAAVLRWMRNGWEMPWDFAAAARAFRRAYAGLHPSVDFSPRPFAVLCASANGVAYEINPPVAFGPRRFDPLSLIKISRPELERIYAADPGAFWELYFQAADAFDLFMGGLNFHPSQAAAGRMHSVAASQLEVTARQLIAGVADGSLPQGMCMVAELALKAVLRERGVGEDGLIGLGHSIPKLAAKLSELAPGANDQELLRVAETMPRYVSVRYDPPPLTGGQAQDLYRRALFLAAEALRRATGPGIYGQMTADRTVPPRSW